jgi:putative DNA primase/helicase
MTTDNEDREDQVRFQNEREAIQAEAQAARADANALCEEAEKLEATAASLQATARVLKTAEAQAEAAVARKQATEARHQARKAVTKAERSEKAASELRTWEEESADALRSWARDCEMKPRIDAAVGLLQKMLTVDPALMDRDPWLLNVRNGTIDLRTGELRDHKPGDFITKLINLEYKPEARSELWERTLAQITGEVALPVGERLLSQFLQRWFGYCATGSVREQAFVVHWGRGSNGKSLVLGTIARVLDEYAGAAAPGLMTDHRGEGGSRHPTEIADLKGKRMVTAQESDENMTLREAFIKAVTGDDPIKARVMRGDFFEFAPTHKLQLVTNHKPAIKGQDEGMWRRVLLVPYLQLFGTQEQVDIGETHWLKDQQLSSKLARREELEGVLAWLVAGAREWYETGLRPPSIVLSAKAEYQAEQDRVRAFVTECCEVDPSAVVRAGVGTGGTAGWSVLLTDPAGMGGGLYPEYSTWCKDSGVYVMGREKFARELRRVVPGCRFVSGKVRAGEGGARRDVLKIEGLRLLPE